MIGLMEDITERKRIDTALRESEARAHMALKAGRMGVWRYDLSTGAQEWSNRQYELFGLEPGAGPPSRDLFLSLVHPEDQALIAFGPENLVPGRGLLDAEFRIIRRSIVSATSWV